jgi:GntR family transcriptional regulator/MocR family aminotransferase
MIAALRGELPEAQLHGASAGLHLTITFSAGFHDVDLASAAFERGVKVQPLSWHCQTPHRPGLVLGYAATPVSAIEQGVSLLAQAYRAVQPAGE